METNPEPPISLASSQDWNQLRVTLRRSGMGALLASYGWDAVRTAALRFDLELLPTELATLTSFLVLGDQIHQEHAEQFLGPTELELLLSSNLVTADADGMVRMNRLRLRSQLGMFMFVDAPSVDAGLYYGAESVALGRLVVGAARGRSLDVCCGVGAQTLVAAMTADEVLAIDSQDAVADVLAINARMNSMDHKVRFAQGDLTLPAQGQQFDFVSCNPPLVPVPERLPYPLVGNGGPDGLSVTRRLLRDLPALLLHPSGVCYCVALLPGDPEGPHLGALDSEVRGLGLRLQVQPLKEFDVGPDSRMIQSLSATVAACGTLRRESAEAAYLDHFQDLAVDRLFTAFLVAGHATSDMRAGVFQSRHYLRGTQPWVV